MNSFTLAESAAWFAGLPASHTFDVRGVAVGVTPDRARDGEGRVTVRFPDGVKRVDLASVRFWPFWLDYPGGGKRRR